MNNKVDYETDENERTAIGSFDDFMEKYPWILLALVLVLGMAAVGIIAVL